MILTSWYSWPGLGSSPWVWAGVIGSLLVNRPRRKGTGYQFKNRLDNNSDFHLRSSSCILCMHISLVLMEIMGWVVPRRDPYGEERKPFVKHPCEWIWKHILQSQLSLQRLQPGWHLGCKLMRNSEQPHGTQPSELPDLKKLCDPVNDCGLICPLLGVIC